MNVPQTAWQITTLSESARALAKQGNWKDAADIYERILAAAPYHVEALSFLAARAMEGNDVERSISLLERVIDVDPSRPRTHMNLGVALHLRGRHSAALASLDRALQLDPSLAVAALNKARVLEALDSKDQALILYKDVWRKHPELEKQLQDRAMPAALRELLEHAATQLRAARSSGFDAVLASLKSGHPGEDLSRLERFAAICLGKLPITYVDAAQQPSYRFFPGLEPLPFYDAAGFDWLRPMEHATDAIRKELLGVLASGDELSPYVDINGVADAGQWQGLNHSLQWSAYHLYKGGRKVELHGQRCPETVTQLDRMPLVTIPDHAPEAFFSILRPATRIPPHYGLANYKLAVHLPLIVPENCAIRVGHQTETWEPGRGLVFDDSFRHEAWNDSDEIRAVLIFEVWNPQLHPVEIEGIKQLAQAQQLIDA